jgi:lambda family phage portal protein
MTSSTARARRLVAGIRDDVGPNEMALVGSPLEAIGNMNRATAMWNPMLLSADRQTGQVKDATDARVRDLWYNEGYVNSGVTIHKDSIVGAAYLFNSKPDYKTLGLDDVWAAEFAEEIEAKFTLWAQSTECYPDAQRTKNFTDILRLAVGIYCATGEYLATTEWSLDRSLPIRTCFQPIELERLCNPYGTIDTPYLRRGIERDAQFAPVAAHIRAAHPTDWNTFNAFIWKRIPMKKAWGRVMVTHIVEQNRPDQTRGLSDIASALGELQMMRKFRGVVLQNALVNSTFAATIESELPSDVVFQSLGGGRENNPEEAITNYAAAYLGSINKYIGGSKNMVIDGVRIPHLYPGTKLKMQPAGTGGPLGQEFEKSMIRYMSATLGVPYEELSHDFSGTNYSSIRAAIQQTGKRMHARKASIADKAANIMFRCWLEEALQKRGFITSMPRVKKIDFYEGLNAEAMCRGDWIGASRGQIDELKETQAAVLRIANNLSTVEIETARLGKDWRKILPQREREMLEEKQRGLPQAGAVSPVSNGQSTQYDDNGDQVDDTQDQPKKTGTGK